MSIVLTRSYGELEFDEFLPDQITAIDVSLQYLNLIVLAGLSVTCLYLVVTLASWWWRLRGNETPLRPFVLGVCFFKFSIAYWAGYAVWQNIAYNMTLPLGTLPARILALIAGVILAKVTTNYYQSSRPDRSLF